MKKIENTLEKLIFMSRWLLAPFYLGLVLAMALLMVKFVKEFIHLVPVMFSGSGPDVIVGVLSLVDVALVANLLLIIVLAGYENFVSRINTENHEDWPAWMGHVGFAELKIKLIGSIVAISGIELLKAFVNADQMEDKVLAWKVGIHLTFVVSGVLFALMDWLSSLKLKHKAHDENSH
ncbi:MAG TPA: TIGR00645 family protein [Gammaproteobacteria bacterium]|nr:TIGR00645 family protein [Gammaproteobacteria bacterium]